MTSQGRPHVSRAVVSDTREWARRPQRVVGPSFLLDMAAYFLPLSICSARTGAAGLHTPANAKRSKWSGRSRLFRHPGARTLASLVAQIIFDVEQRNAETVSANDAVWRHAFKVFR